MRKGPELRLTSGSGTHEGKKREREESQPVIKKKHEESMVVLALHRKQLVKTLTNKLSQRSHKRKHGESSAWCLHYAEISWQGSSQTK